MIFCPYYGQECISKQQKDVSFSGADPVPVGSGLFVSSGPNSDADPWSTTDPCKSNFLVLKYCLKYSFDKIIFYFFNFECH